LGVCFSFSIAYPFYPLNVRCVFLCPSVRPHCSLFCLSCIVSPALLSGLCMVFPSLFSSRPPYAPFFLFARDLRRLLPV
jgi:hypothetical protein